MNGFSGHVENIVNFKNAAKEFVPIRLVKPQEFTAFFAYKLFITALDKHGNQEKLDVMAAVYLASYLDKINA